MHILTNIFKYSKPKIAFLIGTDRVGKFSASKFWVGSFGHARMHIVPKTINYEKHCLK